MNLELVTKQKLERKLVNICANHFAFKKEVFEKYNLTEEDKLAIYIDKDEPYVQSIYFVKATKKEINDAYTVTLSKGTFKIGASKFIKNYEINLEANWIIKHIPVTGMKGFRMIMEN